MKIKLILLWPVVNPPSLHHRPCETLQGEVLGNLWVLVLDIGFDRTDEQCLQHILNDLGVLVLTMNYVDWTLNNWTCLQFTYIFEKISPVQLANNIPGHFCLRNFMYRSLQQKVQCAIDSWKEVLSFSFYLCPWTRLDVRQPKLLAMVLNSTEVEKENFISFQKVSANISSPPCLMTLLAQQ